MSIIKTVNPSVDFWILYPELKLISEFKDKDSKTMWFIVMCFDIDSIYINLPLEERTTLLSKDYMGSKDWYKKNDSKIDTAVEMYKRIIDTPAKAHLRQWVTTLEKRTKFLKDTEYDLDNYDKLDKMAVGTAKIFDTFKIIQEQLNKESGGGDTKGGHKPSLSDSDEI